MTDTTTVPLPAVATANVIAMTHAESPHTACLQGFIMGPYRLVHLVVPAVPEAEGLATSDEHARVSSPPMVPA